MNLLERARPCSIAHTLTVIGDWWSSLIIREMFFGAHRFDELQRRLAVGPNVLSVRLRRLIGLGVIDKIEYQAWPVRHEYHLSEKGLDIYPVAISLAMWGRRWLPPAVDEPALTHVCGEELQTQLCCGACGEQISREDVET